MLRSGRVQFAGVPIVRETLALTKLHKILSDHFDDLEMHDRVSERPKRMVLFAFFSW